MEGKTMGKTAGDGFNVRWVTCWKKITTWSMLFQIHEIVV